ncbi:ATP-binding protein [Marinobacter sp. LV10R510-11A]|uniref:ATP-binding protein n=1 Tax=Marinobacter sp. LV10R510-11A TaxID=1415568 RepID=UPI0039B6EB20
MRSQPGDRLLLMTDGVRRAVESAGSDGHPFDALMNGIQRFTGHRYYFERAARLDRVSGHYIRFSFYHELMHWGGRLSIVCEDSGRGFDFQRHPVLQSTEMAQSGARYGGRGLALLKRLAKSIRFHEQGNRVEIVYDWYL